MQVVPVVPWSMASMAMHFSEWLLKYFLPFKIPIQKQNSLAPPRLFIRGKLDADFQDN
jgi:hypothetical protein